MVRLKLLNNTQKEQLTRLLGFYKYFWICNICGSVYGSDSLEIKNKICPICEVEEQRKKVKKNG